MNLLQALRSRQIHATGGVPRRTRFWLGTILLGGYVMLAAGGGFLAPYAEDDQDLLDLLSSPSRQHLLGTDPLGRDVLSRTILGARSTVMAAMASTVIAACIGVPLGLVAGYCGGFLDTLLSALVDILLTIPLLVLAIAVASVLTTGMAGLVIATSLSFAPPLARLVRARVREIRDEEYILAARALGMSDSRVIYRHVLPNAATVIVIELSLLAGQAVLVATALGFLGLGVQPPTPEWGTMLGHGREYMEIAPHLVLAPGVAITFLVLGFNIFGDGLRDLLDPRSKG
jgi:ABC-type dipeptide/oligopeptide/nickel transport system permease subunit